MLWCALVRVLIRHRDDCYIDSATRENRASPHGVGATET